jgi:Phage integrase, N-terminal SAM-like domain
MDASTGSILRSSRSSAQRPRSVPTRGLVGVLLLLGEARATPGTAARTTARIAGVSEGGRVSIHRRITKSGPRWDVRYREADGSNPSETYRRWEDAHRRDGEVRDTDVRAATSRAHDKERLKEFGERYWDRYAGVDLAHSTQKTYATVWNKHILPRLGNYPLKAIDPYLVQSLKGEMLQSGVGESMVVKTLSVLSVAAPLSPGHGP